MLTLISWKKHLKKMILLASHAEFSILMRQGYRKIHLCSSGDRGQITVLGCVSDGGQIIPPMVIWNRKTVPAQLAQMKCLGTIYGLSTKGWTDQKLFDLWFRKHFLWYAPTDHPLLLLLDGHSSHNCPDTIKLAAEGVTVFTIPPHSSHNPTLGQGAVWSH